MGKLKSNNGGLSFKQKCLLALPGPASVLGSIMIHNVLIKYYTDIIGLDAKYIGWIYVVFNIWNAINDPLFGVWIDRMQYNPKRGKYVYLMRVTAPLMLISIIGMLFANPDWNTWVTFFALLLELFLFDTAFTFYNVSYQSYFLMAAPTTKDRVNIEVIRTYIGNAFGFIVTLIPTFLLVGDGHKELIVPVFTIVVFINALILFISMKNLKENPKMYENIHSEEHLSFKSTIAETFKLLKSKPFLTYLLFYITARGAMQYYYTPFLYFMDDVVNTSGLGATIADTIPGVLMLLLLPLVSKIIQKKGSKEVTLYAYVPAIIGFGCLFFTTNVWITTACYCCIVLSLNMVQTTGVTMGGALVDDDEEKNGVRRTGMVNGIFSLFATTLTSIQSLVFTNVISAFGYDGTLEAQTERAILGIRIGTSLVPIAFILIGLIPLLLFPIGRKREQELSEFSKNARNLENGMVN